jgi:actin-like ATPase involved in cell morphogenesis
MKAIDIGTCFLVSACQDSNNKIQLKSIRDAFIDMENEPQTKKMLGMSKVDFIEAGEKLHIIGDSAVVMANIFKREARRPLSKGVLSPGETDAEKILLVLIENILGKATNQGETCFFSVPAAPVDRDIDIVYHQAMFSKLIGSLGYRPVALNEAAAISYSNAAKEQFSALSISFGAGMCNICLMFRTMIGMAFSISVGGDWLDESAAKATGSTASRIQSIKERGINLVDPNEGDPKTIREREALVIYYKSLVLRALDAIKAEFNKRQGSIELPNAVPIILSGGTSLARGFRDLFEVGFNTVKDKFPIPISEIRMATDPLNAVAQGLLVASMNYDEGMK